MLCCRNRSSYFLSRSSRSLSCNLFLRRRGGCGGTTRHSAPALTQLEQGFCLSHRTLRCWQSTQLVPRVNLMAEKSGCGFSGPMLGAGAGFCDAMVGYFYQLGEPQPAQNESVIYAGSYGAGCMSVWTGRLFVIQGENQMRLRQECVIRLRNMYGNGQTVTLTMRATS